jgi:copper(I)-binding protein
MLMGLKEPLVEYGTFHLTLTFEKAGSIEVEVQVEEAGAAETTH